MRQGAAVRFGIGGRLSLAFAASAAFAIIACIVGWLSYAHLSRSIGQMSRSDLPATISAARLTQLGSAIIGAAPILSQAASVDGVERIKAQIDVSLNDMRDVLSAARSGELGQVRRLVDPLTANLDLIRAKALEAIALRKRNEAMLREIMALHSDFVDEAEPLVDDARFNTRALLEDLAGGRAKAGAHDDIARQTRRAESILQLSSHANLAIGLVSRIASVTTEEQLTVDSHFLAETLDAIRPLLPGLESASDTISLRQIVARLFEIAGAESGLPALRRRELRQRADMAALVDVNRQLIGELDKALADALGAAERRAEASGAAAQEAIGLGRDALLLIAVGAVVASLIAGLFYVRSSLIGRIRSLSNTARMLADGRAPDPIPVAGSDELADMARAMERFRLAQGELVQAAKLAALGHLSAGIAHEINQPLNAIRSHVHNARIFRDRGDEAGLDRSLTKIDGLITRTARIITHLRRFARRSEVTLSPVSPLDAIEGAIALLGPRIREADATISCDVAPEIRVMAEDVRLEQVMVNLLANGVDAIVGQSRREVRIAAERAAGLIRLHVVDTGPGVPPTVARTLFDPFVSTKPAGSGLGLGLSISYNIVRDFGGALRMLDQARGAHFVMGLRDATGESEHGPAVAADRR
jgi:two-component system C4-dicarboxylate transport sensor histidine kinase DctB